MKKCIISFLVATLFLSITNMAIAGSKKQSPIIEKLTFIHYEIPALSQRPIWDDTQDDYKLMYGGIKWHDTPISYEVNPNGSGLNSPHLKSVLEASLGTWDAATSTSLFGTSDITSYDSIGYDGHNRIVWDELDPGIIAVTYIWFIPATKEIIEFDMVFNTYYDWSITGEPQKMDLQDIATHEFGHIGLSDLRSPKDSALTMYGYSSLGETYKQTLGTGDILGIQRLYGK